MQRAVFDVELYRNFFMVVIKNITTGQHRRFRMFDGHPLEKEDLLHALNAFQLVGFNSDTYDIPMIQLALEGYSNQALKQASDEIINQAMPYRTFAENHSLMKPGWDHIDLIQVAPLKASLKLYAGRLHCKKMQDLPIDPEAEVTAEEQEQLYRYCLNDLENTQILLEELSGQIALREELGKQYNQDLRSRSDAQVAERIIAAEIRKINGSYPGRPQGLEGKSYKYKIPAYVSYQLPQLQAMLEKVAAADFVVGPKGAIELPEGLEDLDVKVGGGKYRMGIGGLHSSETTVMHKANEDVLLIDRDVTSYYPSIILNLGLYPQHTGEAFLTVYRTLVERRVEAKKAGDKITAESLKICVNSGFGKFANKWSSLYAPDLLIQVTLTGQLALLMLIEMIETAGMPVISANTDGVTVKCLKSKYDELCEIVKTWENVTGFGTEETHYSALYSVNVNNYLAIKTDGSVKSKGLCANPWEKPGPNVFKLHKNPSTTIVIEAVVALLRDGKPLAETIRGCKDITKFISVRSVTGGASDKGSYLGKAVRWYHSTSTSRSSLNYVKSGNKVPKTDGAKPLMELPDELPKDINYAWYIAEAKAMLGNIGYAQATLFEAA